jgi:hypothetical protein
MKAMIRSLRRWFDGMIGERLLTHREQQLVAFVLAIIIVGGIVQQIRHAGRPAEPPSAVAPTK